MMNNKRGGYPNQMPQQYRYAGPQVQQQQQQQQPQGPPVGVGGAPRNPNAPSNMRSQNGPPRQPQSQQSQQQLHNQQHPGVTGVSVPQHQHQHVATPQQAQQPQPQHQQQQMYGYPAAHNQIIYQAAGYPGIHFQASAQAPFLQQAYQNVRFITPAQPAAAYYLNQAQAQQMYHQPQNQQSMAQHQQGPHANYYAQQYLHQVRLPVSHHAGQGVPSGVQHVPPQQVSQVHSHPPQHVPQHQHAHPSQVAQPQSAQSAQVVNRGEGAPAPVPEKKREKKILKIVDPNTGLSVIGDTPSSNPVTTTEPTQRSATPVEGNGDVSLPVNSSQEPQVVKETSPETPNVEDVSASVTAPKTDKVGSDYPTATATTDVKSNTARAEFYQKITQASDEPPAGKSTSSSISQNANVSSPSPPPETQAPEQPESPPLDANKLQQQTVVTPIANTSSDDSKDASLVSISPTPIELYTTPRSSRRSSPPIPVNEESFLEDDVEELNDTDKSLPEPAKSETAFVDIEVETILPEPEVATVEKADSGCPESIDKDDFDDETPLVNDKEESVCEESSAEEQAPVVVHQNGDLDLEEGEIVVDEEDVVPSAESEADDAESNDSGKDKKKEKIKYDRDFLLNIGSQPNLHTKPDLFPDVAKDAAGNNQMRHGQQVSKSPGGNRDQFNRMSGNRLGQIGGPKQNLMMVGGMQYGPRGGGMMSWGNQPMMVPPPAPRPPKVIELTREEVKLHKAKDAWKPAAIKHRSDRSDRSGAASGPPAGNDQKDEEEIITDDIVKKTRGILNKLTPENFDKLVGKFMGLQLEDKEERISKVITVVFDKAVDEPSFSKEYARMVWKVCSASQETSRKFRKLILDQCQQEFQNSNSDEDKVKILEQQYEDATENKELLKLELEDMKFQMRRRSLGNVRFIGELYKLQMLTPKIMVECVNMLLSTQDEESLECLCKLLTTVGNKLDEQLQDIIDRIHQIQKQPAATQKMPKFIPDEKWMNKTFSNLRNMSDNKKLSSRIRFALLDVVELKENDWKPRRDANAPKTIEEVRRDAFRQEMEEKRQINNLPPPSTDQRGGGPGGSSRQGPQGQQQPKKGSDWNTVQSNKSSRFQMKKPDQAGSLPVLAPPINTWGRSNQTQSNTSGPPSSSRPPPPVTAPRFMNRFQGLHDDSRLNNNSGNQPPSAGYRDRDQMPHTQQYPPAPSPLRRISPAPSSTSSRENSRPVSPKESSPAMRDECTANVNESVKNIFEEYFSVGKFDDTLHWINRRFPDDKISDFVEELSRQVGEMSKLPQQQKAGTLVRSIIKANVISKEVVLSTLAKGVIAELADILIDSPMAATYLAQFLIEIFVDEPNLDWLIAIGEVLLEDEYSKDAWADLVCKTLNLLKSKTNEEVVLSLFAKTKDKSLIPTEDLPWLLSVESLAQKMIPVLKENLLNNEEEIRQVLKENSWDPREELTSKGLIYTICALTWKSETNCWDVELLKKLLPLLPLPNIKIFPKLWKHALEFIAKKGIEQVQQEELWGVMYQLNLTTTIEQKNPE